MIQAAIKITSVVSLSLVLAVPIHSEGIPDFTLEVPVKINGDASQVTGGIWTKCTVLRTFKGALQIHQNYTFALPGEILTPNRKDGTHLATLPWTIPAYMQGEDEWGTSPFDWYCELYQGAETELHRTAAPFVKDGVPASPAGYGSCARIEGQINADFTVSKPGTQICAGKN